MENKAFMVQIVSETETAKELIRETIVSPDFRGYMDIIPMKFEFVSIEFIPGLVTISVKPLQEKPTTEIKPKWFWCEDEFKKGKCEKQCDSCCETQGK